MHPMLNIAIRAARNAGDLIIRSSANLGRLSVAKKSSNDFVSEIDRMAEQEIIRVIKTAYPDHGILAEESGFQQGNDYIWVIDPLDLIHRMK